MTPATVAVTTTATTTATARDRFIRLLPQDLLQIEAADLDFGLYRAPWPGGSPMRGAVGPHRPSWPAWAWKRICSPKS